jgi:hypothetical protein
LGLPEIRQKEKIVTEFDTFWKTYPKRVAKGDARKAWMQTENIRPPLPELLASIEAQVKSDQWRKNDGQFIPYPATWLRQERWDDELKVTLPGVVDGKEWHETWPGIVAKGRELGISEADFIHPQEFKAAVLRGAMRAA